MLIIINSQATMYDINISAAVLDAQGTPPSGILEGNIHWLGSYEQCMRVKATAWTHMLNDTYLTHDFDANYCRAYWAEPLVRVYSKE